MSEIIRKSHNVSIMIYHYILGINITENMFVRIKVLHIIVLFTRVEFVHAKSFNKFIRYGNTKS